MSWGRSVVGSVTATTTTTDERLAPAALTIHRCGGTPPRVWSRLRFMASHSSGPCGRRTPRRCARMPSSSWRPGRAAALALAGGGASPAVRRVAFSGAIWYVGRRALSCWALRNAGNGKGKCSSRVFCCCQHAARHHHGSPIDGRCRGRVAQRLDKVDHQQGVGTAFYWDQLPPFSYTSHNTISFGCSALDRRAERARF